MGESDSFRERIRKLLRLSGGRTDPEAIAARRKARQLASARDYVLEELLEPAPRGAGSGTGTVASDLARDPWREELADALGHGILGVRTAIDRAGRLVVAGTPDATAAFLHRYRRIALGFEYLARGTPWHRTDREAFLLGAAARVRDRLHTGARTGALVVSQGLSAAIRRWLEVQGAKATVPGPIHADDLTSSPAFAAGWRAAGDLSIR